MAEQQEKPQPPVIKFPQGVNNRDREYAVPDSALRECVNMDVTRDGGLLSRKGIRLITDGDCHSLFTHPSGRFVLLVKNGALNRLVGSTLTSLVNVDGPVSYVVLNDDVYWSSNSGIGQIKANGEIGLWGMATPPVPQATGISNGGLFAGTYQVAMTAIHSTGIESGALDTVAIEVPSGGGIQVVAPSSSGVRFAVYLTSANGGQEELRLATMIDPGTTVLIGPQPLGKLLESLFAVRPLPSQQLIHHKGRLWAASGNVVWFTSDRSPHWLFPNTGYYLFESTVTMLGAAEDGVYVGTCDKTYYLQGSDPYNMTQRQVSSVGAAANSVSEIPFDILLSEGSFPSRQCAWWDTEGFLCIGKPGGIVVRPTKSRFSAGTTDQVVVAYRNYEGLRQLVSILNSKIGPLIATNKAIQQTFLNGVVLN